MPPVQEHKKEESKNLNNDIPVNDNESGSMLEEIEMGSGCVADMQKTVNPSPSQKEIEMGDILDSAMLSKAKELFDIKKITVKTKT